MTPCNLCHSTDTSLFYHDKNRKYWQCHQCDLIFVPPAYFLSEKEEQAIYDLHQNDVADQGYLKFLFRAIEPIAKYLANDVTVLDYGSGPGPAMPTLLSPYNVSIRLYDKFYANESELLRQQYDVVIATEVVEHFDRPDNYWQQLFSLVKQQGILSIMTKRHLGQERFTHWHYKNDLTHICFYSEKTLSKIAKDYGARVEFPSADVAIFFKIL